MEFYRVGNKNMFVSSCGCFMKSYDKIIVVKKGGKIYLNADYYDYSLTTARHRNYFLNVTQKEFEENDKKGLYNYLSNDEIMEIYYAYIS